MKRMVSLIAVVLVLLAGIALAQQPQAQPKPESGQQQMQGGMCPMMAGGGMTGMMEFQADSPKMMQMRGEMMKAMGEVMMKYGKMMEGARRQCHRLRLDGESTTL
jgi:hypothetical protein